MRLTTIWEDYQEFEDLCLVSGKNSTKETIRKIRKEWFNENDYFIGDWHKLLFEIVRIFVNDKIMSKKFDYSKDLIERTRIVLQPVNNSDSKELVSGIFNKLIGTSKLTSNGEFQIWNSPTKSYEIIDNIILTPTINTDNLGKVSIVANTLETNIYHLIFNVNNTEYYMEMYYENDTYKYTENIATGKKVRMSKYPEVIHFVNMKYFNKFPENLSYNQFKYIVLAFSVNKLFVPSLNKPSNILKNQGSSTVLQNTQQALNYFKDADTNFANIQFTYGVSSFYNRFHIKRDNDDNFNNMMEESEKQWGDKRSKYPLSPRATSRTFNDPKDKNNE